MISQSCKSRNSVGGYHAQLNYENHRNAARSKSFLPLLYKPTLQRSWRLFTKVHILNQSWSNGAKMDWQIQFIAWLHTQCSEHNQYYIIFLAYKQGWNQNLMIDLVLEVFPSYISSNLKQLQTKDVNYASATSLPFIKQLCVLSHLRSAQAEGTF